ncbi:MAG TPA: hypothetical protein VEB60_02680, partial [Candidatus Paceibacterota bacterium]|nr:hypothetical protein [Candidatus Paceibacterota bacterium]
CYTVDARTRTFDRYRARVFRPGYHLQRIKKQATAMSDTILKILELLFFAIISIIFVPMLVIVHYYTEHYEKWLGNIMKM